MDKTFGKYLIEQKIGQGSISAVYLATDSDSSRKTVPLTGSRSGADSPVPPEREGKIVLKIITSDDQELQERFRREAQAITKLKHPNIVQVHEAGTINNQNYLTMDYIDGISLDNMVTSTQRPSLQYVAKIIMQIASALHYAHTQGIIHRAVKPANIMIDKNDNIFLADFGLAKRITNIDKSVMTGDAGSLNYLSPEQAMGKTADRVSDIFSLGATFYHCLTGKPPFQTNSPSRVLSVIINDEPAPPKTIIHSIPKEIENICLKCLEKDKAKRYQTAGELAADLQRYLQQKSTTAGGASSLVRIWNKIITKKTAFIAVGTAAVILLAVLINWLITVSGTAHKLETYRKEAQGLFNQGRYEDARSICDKILTISPSEEGIKSLADACNTAIKQKEIAAKTTERKLSIREQAQKILERLNNSMPPDSRIKIAQAAIDTDNAFGEAYQILGYAYKDKKDFDKAYDYFTRAIQTESTLACSYCERGLITAYVRNKPEEAIVDFEKAIQYDPDSYLGYFARGNIEQNQQKYDNAVKSYTAAIGKKPDFIWAHNNRGMTYFKTAQSLYPDGLAPGRVETAPDKLNPDLETLRNKYRELINKAISDYDKAVKINPIEAACYNNRGKTYAEIGESEKAMADYNEAIKCNPKMAEAYNNRGLLYKRQDKPELALADFNNAIRSDPKQAEAYCNRGNIYEEKHNMDNALSDYSEAISINPKYAIAYYNRCMAYYNSGKYPQALADGETFLKFIHNEPFGNTQDKSGESTPKQQLVTNIKQIVETCKKNIK
ncbi:MAG: tetratricopeptide repeat protein [Planctomycetota bacterium]